MSMFPRGCRSASCCSRFLHKYVIFHGVPGIVNANKEDQQGRSANHEQGWAHMGVSHICRKRKQDMKQPVFKHGLVDGLHSQTPSHDDGVYYP